MLQPQIEKRPAPKTHKARKSAPNPEVKDETLMTKEEFFAKIDRARAQTGGIVLRTREELEAYLNGI